GVATFHTSALAVGTHSVTAVYTSDSANLAGSAAAPLSEQVTAAATKTTLSTSLATAVFGQAVMLKATISVVAPGAGAPKGTVTFKDGATVIGTGTIVNGVVTFQTNKLTKGTHTITVVYSGDVNFLASTSQSLVVTIQ